MAPNLIHFRNTGPEDDLFQFRLYASTRAEELALVHWTPLQQNTFLQMQFNAQRRSYAVQFPGAETQLILLDGRPAGRLIVERTAAEIRLIDIALLPEYRRRGIGTQILQALLAEAAQARVPVRLHVETFNPAQRLYERLGFQKTGLAGLYFAMEWRPEPEHPQDPQQVLNTLEP